MSSFPFINSRYGKYLDTVATVDDLRDYPTPRLTNSDIVVVTANTAIGDGNGGVYAWAARATGADDGINTIKPFSVITGRWIKAFGKGDRGATGPSDADFEGPDGSKLVGYGPITAGTALDRLNSSSQLDAFLAGLTGQYIEDSTATIQSLFNRADTDFRDVAGTVHLPRGQYRQTAPFKMPNSMVLSGDGARATKLQSFIDGNRDFPLLTNAVPGGALFHTIKDIGLWGGTAGYYLDAAEGSDGLHFDNVVFLGQKQAGIDIERLFQTTVLNHCEFEQSTRGIRVKEHTSNAITMTGGGFKSLSEAALELNGVEGFNCYGVRFEGGGDPNRPDKRTIDLQNVRNIQFDGCYFENTHGTLLRSRLTGGIGPTLAKDGGCIAFKGCHFTQAAGGVSYTWDVEGPISFTDCDSFVPMRVPPQAILNGHNRGLIQSIRSGKLISKQIRPTNGANFLITFDLADALPAISNLNVLTGRLSINFGRLDVNGGGYATFSREYLVTVRSVAGLDLVGEVKLITANDMSPGDGGPGLAVAAVGATDRNMQLVANIANITANDPSCFLTWTFEWNQGSQINGNLFGVGLA